MGAITLKNFRTTADVTMNTRLKDGGVSIDWAGLTNIKAWLFSDAQKAIAGRCDVSINQADSTLLVCEYSASKPQYLGVNRLILQAKYQGRTKTYDVPVFNFVSRTAAATGTVTIDDPTVDVEIEVQDVTSSILDNIIAAALDAAARAEAAAQEAEHMVDIHTGPEGKSAYEVAVAEGYTGTEEEWLASLKGPVGETPDISIGTVTTVEPGQPAGASMGGTPEAPVLNLSIPQGRVGATPNFTIGTVTTGQPGTPVVITITGTAEAPVLNIQIPQGMKGDTGVSADYPITIHNGLDSDATDEALAAFQGKVLDGKFSQLDLQLNGEGAYDATLTESITQGSTHTATKRTLTNKLEAGKEYIIGLSPGTVVNKITFYTFDENNNAVYCKYGQASTTSTSKTFSPGNSMKILPSADVYKYAAFCSAGDALQTGDVYFTIQRNGTSGLADTVEDLTDDVESMSGEIDGIAEAVESIEGNVESLSEEIAGLADLDGIEDFFGTTKNLFDPTDPDFEPGYWLNFATGAKNADSTFAISPYIKLTQAIGTLVASVNGVQQNYGGYGICLYDSSKNYVTGWKEGTKGYAEWQNGVAYARFSLKDYANGNIQIEQGTTPTSYVPYKAGLKGEDILPGTVGTDAIADGAITEDKLSGSVTAGGPIAYSYLGGESRVATIASLANDRLSITDYPRHLKRSGNISASANITAFDNIIVGVINGSDNYNALYAKVDATKVYLCRRFPDERIISQVEHGMTISTFIKVAFQYRDNVAKVVVSTLADIKSFDFTNAYIDSYGYPVCEAGANSQFTDVVLRAGSADMRKPVWVFGDSYVSFYSARWPYYLLPERLDIDKYALFGLAGGNAEELFQDVEKALMTNTPKFLVWCLGMNNADTSSAVNSSWKSVWDSLTAICEARGIILIGATIPNVPGRRMTFKNDIVRNSGYRYIDFAKAVNAEEAGASWYAGCLDEDNVHPTEAGAKVLCSQVLEDFPEIMDRDAIFD